MRRLHLALRYALGLAQLRTTDVLTASFPRSGSTFLRLILAGLATGDASAIETHDRFERTVPELGGAHRWNRMGDTPLFIKTHRPYAPLLARPRAILLVRHPLDALASFYAYRSALSGVPALPISAFLRDARVGLPRWIQHTRSWRPRVQHTVRFNALCENPTQEVTSMMQALDMPLSLDSLGQAIGLATPEAAHQLRATRRGGDQLDPAFEFARASSRHTRISFSPEDEAWAFRQLDHAELMPLVEAL